LKKGNPKSAVKGSKFKKKPSMIIEEMENESSIFLADQSNIIPTIQN
jgi:hypothetical protein